MNIPSFCFLVNKNYTNKKQLLWKKRETAGYGYDFTRDWDGLEA